MIDLTFPFGEGASVSLATEEGLETAIFLSLFTDWRAGGIAGAAADSDAVGGWWGHTFGEFGSRLWLLRREKTTPEVEARARQYAEESLAWLTREKWCKEISAQVERRPQGLALLVTFIGAKSAQARSLSYMFRWWE